MNYIKYLLIKLKAKIYLEGLFISKMPWHKPTKPTYNNVAYWSGKVIWYVWVSDLDFRKVINDKLSKIGIDINNVRYIYRREVYENK